MKKEGRKRENGAACIGSIVFFRFVSLSLASQVSKLALAYLGKLSAVHLSLRQVSSLPIATLFRSPSPLLAEPCQVFAASQMASTRRQLEEEKEERDFEWESVEREQARESLCG